MIYLKNQGVSENVISALLPAGPPSTPAPAGSAAPVPPPPPSATASGTPSAPTLAPTGSQEPPEPAGGTTTTAAPPATPAEPVVNADYVQEQLSPYGRWVDVPGYDRQCWQPSELPDGWRPYYDSGHWVYTDAGLYWQSDYPWGAIPFHYGRWAYVGGYGWIWAPGYEYAPAWVYWRHCDGYLGWAPLPYGAAWVSGVWWYHGVRVVDCDFGFGPRYFVFVDQRHFWEHDYHPFVVRGVERDRIYRISVINRVRVDERGRFVHEGLEREHLERLTGRRVEEVRHEELRNREHEALRVDHQRVMEHGGHASAVPKGEQHVQPERNAKSDEQHGKPEQHAQPEQRGQPEQHAQPQQQRQAQQQGRPEEHAQPQPQGQGQQQGPSQQQARPEQHGKPEDKGKPEEKGKDDQKNQNQSKGNTNQHFAQLKGSAGS